MFFRLTCSVQRVMDPQKEVSMLPAGAQINDNDSPLMVNSYDDNLDDNYTEFCLPTVSEDARVTTTLELNGVLLFLHCLYLEN